MFKKKDVIGITLSVLIAIIAYFLNLSVLTGLGAPTISILLGIILGNLYFHQLQLESGTAWSEKKLLEYSVMLLGATVTFQTIQKLGWSGVAFIVLQMTLTIAFVLFIGGKLGFSKNDARLMAAGNAVCGSSAIAAVDPVVGATIKERRTSITMVNLMGTVLMLTLPAIGTWVFGSSNFLRGALIGGTVQSVGQVVASGTMVNQATTTTATLFKIMRIMLLVFVVLFFGMQHRREQGQSSKSNQITVKRNSFLPWYVLGFLILCVLNTGIHFPPFVSDAAHFLSSWCETIALAAIGLRLNIIEFIKAGKKLMIYGFATIAFQVLLALLLISLLLK
ncbi:MAG: YeiH family protein [Lactococcus sp.]